LAKAAAPTILVANPCRVAVRDLVEPYGLRLSPAPAAAQPVHGVGKRPVGVVPEHELHRIIDCALAALDFDPACDEIRQARCPRVFRRREIVR